MIKWAVSGNLTSAKFNLAFLSDASGGTVETVPDSGCEMEDHKEEEMARSEVSYTDTAFMFH
jgi:hypothetical protein